MKILLTGSNSRQCGLARLNSKRIFDALNLSQMLSTFADVDFNDVSNIVDFSKYDAIIVGVGTIGSPTYPYLMNALYSIGKSDKCILYLEDWKCPKFIKKDFASLLSKGYEAFIEKTYNKAWSGGAKFYKFTDGTLDPKMMWRGIEKIVNDLSSFKFIIPAFNWGDKSIVSNILGVNVEDILHFDQTPYLIEKHNIQDVPYKHGRLKKFLYCGLSNQDTWLKKQGIKDITDCFGHSPYEKLDTEDDVNAKHSEYLGIAIPEYYHSGSGWFRMRYIYSAMAKNICYASANDAKALGIKTLQSFDGIADDELEAIAIDTYNAIKKYIPSKEEEVARLKLQFERAIQNLK